MPVPIDRTDARLDTIIQVAQGKLGTEGADGITYSVSRINGTNSLGPLVFAWNARILNDDLDRLLLTVELPGFPGAGSDDFSTNTEWWPLDGLFPVGTPLLIDGTEPLVVGSLEIPQAGVLDTPLLTADGHAEWSRGRLGVQYRSVLALTGYLHNFVTAGVIVQLRTPFLNSDADPVLAIGSRTSAQLSISEDSPLNITLTNYRDIWAQLADRTILPLQQPDGLFASDVVYEDTIEWIVREDIDTSSVIVLDGRVYGISSVQPLSRGRLYAVTASRRFVGISV